MSKNHTSELDYDLLISQAIDWILDKDTEHDVDLLEHIKTLQKVLLSEEAKAGTKKAGLLEWLADLLEIYEGFAVSQLKHKIGDVIKDHPQLRKHLPGLSEDLAGSAKKPQASEMSPAYYILPGNAAEHLSEDELIYNELLVAMYHITFTSQLWLCIDEWLRINNSHVHGDSTSKDKNKNSLYNYFFDAKGRALSEISVSYVSMECDKASQEEHMRQIVEDFIACYVAPPDARYIESVKNHLRPPIDQEAIDMLGQWRIKHLRNSDTLLEILAQGQHPTLATHASYFLFPDVLRFSKRYLANGTPEEILDVVQQHIDENIRPFLPHGKVEHTMHTYLGALKYYGYRAEAKFRARTGKSSGRKIV